MASSYPPVTDYVYPPVTYERPASAAERRAASARSSRRSGWHLACTRGRRPTGSRRSVAIVSSLHHAAGPSTNVTSGRASATERSNSLMWATRASSARSGSGGTPAPFGLHRPHARRPRAGRRARPAASCRRVPRCRLVGEELVPLRRAERCTVPTRARGRTRPMRRARRARRRRRSALASAQCCVQPRRCCSNELVNDVRALSTRPVVVHAAAVERVVADRERVARCPTAG